MGLDGSVSLLHQALFADFAVDGTGQLCYVEPALLAAVIITPPGVECRLTDGTIQSLVLPDSFINSLEFDPSNRLYYGIADNIYRFEGGTATALIATVTVQGTLTLGGTSGGAIYTVDYVRDKLGRITQKTETVLGDTRQYTYAYDIAGRLETVTKDGITVSSYVYDANGNRLSRTAPTGSESGAYDAQDRLISYGSATYTYTANGELLTKTENGQTTSYNYDVLGNLISVQLPDGSNLEYIIDGRNQRIGKKVDGALIQGFLYQDQLNPLAELDGQGNVVATFVYGSKANVPDYMVKGGTTYRIISDHLGSPRLIVDATTGAVAQRMEYDEFGNMLFDSISRFSAVWICGWNL